MEFSPARIPPADHAATDPPAAVPVAAYVRMSTDHQQYSTANQMARIEEFARAHGMEVVLVYVDQGKSGLQLRGRESLQQLIRDVTDGHATYRAILVYDVSRWGRFQDADESGYYEYICKRAGIAVHYCAEMFENDGSPVSNIVKSLKRSMAAEFSRELSSRCFAGACRLIQLGFKQGGPSGFGLRRLVVDSAGQPKCILERGEYKALQNDRVVLVPGPEEEQAIVREIYAMYLSGRSEPNILRELRARRLPGPGKDGLWTNNTLTDVLRNEKYAGNCVYHRTSYRLHKKFVSNPPELWIRRDGAFRPIVPPAQFAAVQREIKARSRRATDEELLEALRDLLAKYGRISTSVIERHCDVAHYQTIARRFGDLSKAYDRVGYRPPRSLSFVGLHRALRLRRPQLMAEIEEGIQRSGGVVSRLPGTNQLALEGEATLSIVLAATLWTRDNTPVWFVRVNERPDLTLVARLDLENRALRDYYVFTREFMRARAPSRYFRLHAFNTADIDQFRFPDLSVFYALAARAHVEEVI